MTQKEIWDRITDPKNGNIKNLGVAMVKAVRKQ